MIFVHRLLSTAILIFSICAPLTAQISEPAVPRGFQSVRLTLYPADTLYSLGVEFILPGSEVVWVDSSQKLAREVEYELDHRYGRITFHRSYLQKLFSDSAGHFIFIVFRNLPLAFKPEYTLRQGAVARDTVSGERVTTFAPAEQSPLDDLFGAGLSKSGSITRGFTVGSNRDLSLSSGFRMQLAGNLGQDVDITAALTDENTPIQPEGNTQTLQEIDKVFIELTAPRYSATLGDFNYQVNARQGGEFGRVARKLQGASGTLNFWRDGSSVSHISLTGATQRGKFNTNEFRGIEGSQGPYQLTGRNGERRVVIIAGSERVFLNGEQMTRGEVQDYTIDYSSGEVFFTSQRLITNASRITVDFEYADRQFTRNLFGGGLEASFLNNSVRFNARYLQEADDSDSPLDVPLDGATRDILSQSGSDRFMASVPGARIVGRDSLTGVGAGQYVLRDTMFNGMPVSIFVYAPGDTNAIFTVSFSIVDRMPSDSAGYVREGIGRFRFAGIGQGNYLPIQFLPMPQLHRLLDLNASAELGSNFSITGEYAASQLDLNRLSMIDNNGREGSAFKLGILYSPKDVDISGFRLGDIDVSLTERYVDRRFSSLARFNEVEFNRSWNLEPAQTGNEEIREASLSIRPGAGTHVSARYGLLNIQDSYKSTRLQTNLSLKDSASNGIQFQREDIGSLNLVFNESSNWIRQKGEAEYGFWMFRPGLRVESEERILSSPNSDSVRQGSFQFVEISPRLATRDIPNLNVSAELQIRAEDSSGTRQMQEAFTSLTQLYDAEYRSGPSFTTQLGLSYRQTKFTDAFRQRGNTDSDILLVRSQSRYTPLERMVDATVFYEFANQSAAKYERVFLRVPRGTGNYRYKGDLNGNGIPEDEEFELTRFDGDYVVLYAPGDQLVPVLDLKASIRLRLEPQRLLRQPGTTFGKILAALSSETLFRVEERSTERDTKHIYLLNLSRFLNAQTTLSGTQYFTQDLYVYEHRADFSTRLRFSQRKSLVQLVAATEQSITTERSVRVRSQLLPEIGNQTEVVHKLDRVSASASTPRERDLTITSVNSDFSYRPEPAWEVGFRLEVGRVEDHFRNPAPVVDMNEQSLRTSYALFGTGQFRAEIKREEVILAQGLQDPQRPFPYEFTNGKVLGKSMLWQLAFDYRFSQHIQVMLQYNGRKEGDREIVHLGQVEAKVFF